MSVAMSASSCRLWEDIRVVIFWVWVRSRMMLRSSSRAAGSRPLMGSSRIRHSGWWDKAKMSLALASMPLERFFTVFEVSRSKSRESLWQVDSHQVGQEWAPI